MVGEDDYDILAKKLDAAVNGLSPLGTQGNVSETWMEYLRTLLTPEEVKWIIHLPVFPSFMSVGKYAKKIGKTKEEAQDILEKLFKTDCVMTLGAKQNKYAIHFPLFIFDGPPLSFDEYPPEKAKKLAELSYKYLVEEEWYRNFEGSAETPLSRVIPVQESIKTESSIIPYEDIIKLIDNAETLGLQACVCRKRLEVLGKRTCTEKYPLETCIAIDAGAQYTIKRGHAREITKEEAKKLLKEFNKMGLIHCTENFAQGSHNLICNCCSCCCNLIGGITRWDNPRAVAAANYIATLKQPENCVNCELCVEKCNFKAITISDSGPVINKDKCMGCGVCVVNCPEEIIELKRLDREVIYDNLAVLGLKIAKETNRKVTL